MQPTYTLVGSCRSRLSLIRAPQKWFSVLSNNVQSKSNDRGRVATYQLQRLMIMSRSPLILLYTPDFCPIHKGTPKTVFALAKMAHRLEYFIPAIEQRVTPAASGSGVHYRTDGNKSVLTRCEWNPLGNDGPSLGNDALRAKCAFVSSALSRSTKACADGGSEPASPRICMCFGALVVAAATQPTMSR